MYVCVCVVLRPLNVKARLILAMKPRQENFGRPMFDIKVDLDEISLNINREQVNLLHHHQPLHSFQYLLVF